MNAAREVAFALWFLRVLTFMLAIGVALGGCGGAALPGMVPGPCVDGALPSPDSLPSDGGVDGAPAPCHCFRRADGTCPAACEVCCG